VRTIQSILPTLLAITLAFATSTAFVRQAWAVGAFQIAIFILLGLAATTLDWRQRPQLPGLLPLLLPAWGLLQLFAGLTSSPSDTRSAVLNLSALAAVYILAFRVAESDSARRVFLELFLWFATASAALCLTQLFTSQGKVLWIFDSGYPDVFGTFAYYNNYAQFVELALPLALWGALTDHRHPWVYALAGGTLYASVIGSTSRAGTLLCTVEVVAMLVITRLSHGNQASGKRRPPSPAMLAIVPILAILFTFVVGGERVWQRFFVNDPYIVRREFLIAAVDMVKQRPSTGFGLGTFPGNYKKYAVRDFPFYANHAHNDWAEAAAEGGLPYLALFLLPFVFAIPKMIRHPWSLGLLAVMLHAWVDYPFPRPAVSGWIMALLGLLYAVEARVLPAKPSG